MNSSEFLTLNEKLKVLTKQIRSHQIVSSDSALTGAASCCALYGIDKTTGNEYYVDGSGNWQPISSGSGVLPQVANDFANDAAAATGGILVGGLYHTSGVVKVRLT